MQTERDDEGLDEALEQAAASLEGDEPALAQRPVQVEGPGPLEVRAYLDLGMLEPARDRLGAAASSQ